MDKRGANGNNMDSSDRQTEPPSAAFLKSIGLEDSLAANDRDRSPGNGFAQGRCLAIAEERSTNLTPGCSQNVRRHLSSAQ
jgi:hypothetical protein